MIRNLRKDIPFPFHQNIFQKKTMSRANGDIENETYKSLRRNFGFENLKPILMSDMCSSLQFNNDFIH